VRFVAQNASETIWRSVPVGGAYSANPDPLAGFKGVEGGMEGTGKGWKRKVEWREREYGIKGRDGKLRPQYVHRLL